MKTLYLLCNDNLYLTQNLKNIVLDANTRFYPLIINELVPTVTKTCIQFFH